MENISYLPPSLNTNENGADDKTPVQKSDIAGCTMKEYSDYTGVPELELQKFGVSEATWGDKKVVKIPYYNEQQKINAIRYRTALTGKNRFRWKKDNTPTLYGLSNRDLYLQQKGKEVILVEGESDCHVLWSHYLPAFGVPGVSNFNAACIEALRDFDAIYLWVESDSGGETLLEAVKKSSINSKVRMMNYVVS